MATISSNGTGGGLASLGASWAGGVAPVSGDKVNIVSGDTIELDGTYTWGDNTTTAINIKGGGILKFSRSVNSELSCNGELVVEATSTGGTFDMGTESDPIPSGVYSTIKLNATSSPSTTRFRLLVNGTPGTSGNYAKFYCHGATRTVNTRLNGSISVGATSAVVDDTTGWEVGDDVIISSTASTTAGRDYWDKVTISTINHGTKTITFSAITYGHLDRAYVGNLSSNVTITSSNTANGSHGGIRIDKSSNANEGIDSIYWRYTAFKHLGNSNLDAIYITAGGRTQRTWKYIKDCSFSTDTNQTFLMYAYSFKQNDFKLENCAFSSYGRTSASSGLYLANGCYLGADDTVFYSIYNATCLTGVNGFGAISNTFNRCVFGSSRWTHSGSATTMTFNDCVHFLNTDDMFAGTLGFGNVFNRCKIGVADWGNSPVNRVFSFSNGNTSDAVFNDCEFNYTSVTTADANRRLAFEPSKFIFSNKDVNPLEQYIYRVGGTLSRDNTTYKAGGSSLKFASINSALLPVDVEFKVFAPTDKPITVSGYLRKNSSYGSSTRPYVELSGLGITTSTYTMTDVNDTWEQFTVSGTQTTGTDGILTLKVVFQSANNGAEAWIDEVSAPTPVAVNSGGFEYWSGGQPSQIITANYVAPVDVWNVLKTDATLTDSMGEQVNKIKNDTGLIPATL